MSDVPLDEVIHFDAITSSLTGAAADADATPTFAVYEQDTDTDIGIGGNLTKRTSLTGNYRGSFTASAANGFEVGKWYVVIGSATIGGIATKGVLMHFRIVAAEAAAGVPKVDVDTIKTNPVVNGGTITFPSNQTVASAANVADVETDTQNIQSRIPAALTGDGNIKADALKINGANTPANLSALGITVDGKIVNVALVDTLTTYTNNTPQTGDVYSVLLAGLYLSQVDSSPAPTSTSFKLVAGASSENDFYADRTVRITSGAASTLARVCTSYDGATKVLTFDEAWTVVPTVGASVQIVSDHVHAVSQIQSGLATEVSALAIKAKTDLIPASPASTTNITAATGCVLSSVGLDQIPTTAPSGVASTFREMLVQTWRRFFKKAIKTSADIKTYADNETTVITTQAISESASTETQGAST